MLVYHGRNVKLTLSSHLMIIVDTFDYNEYNTCQLIIITVSLSTCGPVAEQASVAGEGGGGLPRYTHASRV